MGLSLNARFFFFAVAGFLCSVFLPRELEPTRDLSLFSLPPCKELLYSLSLSFHTFLLFSLFPFPAVFFPLRLFCGIAWAQPSFISPIETRKRVQDRVLPSHSQGLFPVESFSGTLRGCQLEAFFSPLLIIGETQRGQSPWTTL